MIEEKNNEKKKWEIIALTATDNFEANKNIIRLTKEIEDIKDGETVSTESSKEDPKKKPKNDSDKDATVNEGEENVVRIVHKQVVKRPVSVKTGTVPSPSGVRRAERQVFKDILTKGMFNDAKETMEKAVKSKTKAKAGT